MNASAIAGAADSAGNGFVTTVRPRSAASVRYLLRFGDYSRMMCFRLRALTLAAIALTGVLAGCSVDNYVPKTEPSMYRSLAQPGAQLDDAAAASMISGYRANNNLPAVTLDPELTRLARGQAEVMAQRDRLDHNAGKPFIGRLKASGYDAKTAAENIGAGYHTLAEAFSGWRDSPPHKANMLLKSATRMGIAAVYTPKSKYKVYWALIMAEPEDGKR